MRPFRKGPKRPGKQRPVEPLEDILTKKRKHWLKLIAKEVKRSKQFEARKIVRRLKEASGGNDVSAVEKLEKQLNVARSADTAKLALTTAISNDICPKDAEDNDQEQNVENVVYQRIMAAKCVTEKVAEIKQEMKDIEQKATRQAARAEKAAAAVENAEDGKGDADKKRKAEEKHVVDEAALQALKKLKTRSGAAVDAGTDDGSASDDDSGVIEDPDALSDLSEDSEDPGEQDNSNKTSKGQKQAAKPKKPQKPKNRLGQRARRLLAERVHGDAAAHLRNQKQQSYRNDRHQYNGDAPPVRTGKPSLKPPAARKVQEPMLTPEELHPSWAAKKKQIEEQKRQLFAAQGTKVTFDDDD